MDLGFMLSRASVVLAVVASAISMISLWKKALAETCFVLGVITCVMLITDIVYAVAIFWRTPNPVSIILIIFCGLYTLSTYKLTNEKTRVKGHIALLVLNMTLAIVHGIAISQMLLLANEGLFDLARTVGIFALMLMWDHLFSIVAFAVGLAGIIFFNNAKSAKICFIGGVIFCVASLPNIIMSIMLLAYSL
jgi:hypothetical protein